MNLQSTFSIGDRVWVCDSRQRPFQGTVGMVRVEVTDSPGVNGGEVEPGWTIAFDNYKPQKSMVEEYMLVETGIGSGCVYRISEEQTSIFATEQECVLAIAAARVAMEATV